MRRFVLYLRQCFCAHEFQAEEGYVQDRGEFTDRSGAKVAQYCPKCGYHRSFWKWL